MGRYICSEREKRNGLIIGTALILSGTVLTTVSIVQLVKTNNESDTSPGSPVPSSQFGGLLFSGSLITYAGLVLVPLYATSKSE
jgi:ABC-type uncharacterized transport system permease subunit